MAALASLGASLLPALGSLFAVGQEKISATQAEEQAMSAWVRLAYQPEAGNLTVSAARAQMAQVYQAIQSAAQKDPRLDTSAPTGLAGYLGPASAGGGGIGGLIPVASKTWQFIAANLPARGSIDDAYQVMLAAASAGAPSLSSPSAMLGSIFGGGGSSNRIVIIIGAVLAVAAIIAILKK